MYKGTLVYQDRAATHSRVVQRMGQPPRLHALRLPRAAPASATGILRVTLPMSPSLSFLESDKKSHSAFGCVFALALRASPDRTAAYVQTLASPPPRRLPAQRRRSEQWRLWKSSRCLQSHAGGPGFWPHIHAGRGGWREFE